jgi:probable HAF family extracellular repeat protein
MPVCSAASYTITDLGATGLIDSGNYFAVVEINNSGTISGTYKFPGAPNGYYHASSYSGGVQTDLGTLGSLVSNAQDINDSGQIVGRSYTANRGPEHAFLYSQGTMLDLGTLGGLYSIGYGINNQGQVTGSAYTTGNAYHAFLYKDGVMHDLGTLPGLPNSSGKALNSSGQIVGSSSGAAGTSHAFLYSNGAMQDLGPGLAFDINEAGQVVGQAGTNAFLYSQGVMQVLGSLDSTWRGSSAYGINNTGEIVGSSTVRIGDALHGHAFLYVAGAMHDLNEFIDPSTGWELNAATGINDHGQIVGWGRILVNGAREDHAFLLTPIPEPSSFALAALGLIGLTASGWRKRSRVARLPSRCASG